MLYPYEITGEVNPRSTDVRNNFNFISSSTHYTPSYTNYSDHLYGLDSDKYFLKTLLPITITVEDDCYRAENESLGIWATGETIGETLDSLKEEIILLYEELKETGESNLGSDPLKWWGLLKEVIVEK